MKAVLSKFRPDVVYHLAAQHDPGLAETEVASTLGTNIFGTVNVIEACKKFPPAHLAAASTGKALRPFSRDIYAASKKATEWVLADAARKELFALSAVRFTHVVDNSIILRRLFEWTRDNSPIRLHSTDTVFYLQSALEAAQLLMSSVLEPSPGRLALAAIRDLGWPLSLLDLAVGVIAETESRSPLYRCGFEAGYEVLPYPALYDPQLSGDRSPLFSSLEVAQVDDSPYSPDIDVMHKRLLPDRRLSTLVERVGLDSTRGASAVSLRAQIAKCGWAMLQNSLHALPPELIDRHMSLLSHLAPSQLVGDDAQVALMIARCANEEATRSRSARDAA
jgi:hypothetical protein